MRAGPIGLFRDIYHVKKNAAIQAAVTHDTPLGILAAQASALMVHYFRYRFGPKEKLAAFLEEHAPGQPWSEPWKGKVGHLGVMSGRAAVSAIIAVSRLSDLLHACITYTGDVDTVATIALGSASWSEEIEKDLPKQLFENLEHSPFGFKYLAQLDRQLGELAL